MAIDFGAQFMVPSLDREPL